MEKSKKTYNEQLNERGDAAFIMKKHIDKDNNIKKAFIFVPGAKAIKLLELLNRKGGDNKIGMEKITDAMVLIRNNNIVGIVKDGKIDFGNYKSQGYTGRGLRLNEKHIEGLIDYAKTYGKVEKPEVFLLDILPSIADSFKTSAAALTIDDLLDL